MNRVAMTIVGLMLGGLLLLFERLLAGSWRELAAIMAAVATLSGVAFVGNRALRKYRVNAAKRLGLLWALPISALLGAFAGAAYAIVSREHHGAGPAAVGAWTMVMLTLASAIWNRRTR